MDGASNCGRHLLLPAVTGQVLAGAAHGHARAHRCDRRTGDLSLCPRAHWAALPSWFRTMGAPSTWYASPPTAKTGYPAGPARFAFDGSRRAPRIGCRQPEGDRALYVGVSALAVDQANLLRARWVLAEPTGPRDLRTRRRGRFPRTVRGALVAAEISADTADFGHLEPMVAAAEDELAAVGVTDTRGGVADVGYWHQAQMETG